MADIKKSQWVEKLKMVGRQTRQMMHPVRAHVVCGCNKNINHVNAFRCLYCGEWFCKTCAEIHFGKTVEQYREENPIIEDPKPLCSGLKVFPTGKKCDGCNDCSLTL